MITLDGVTMAFGSRVLFENVTITFNEGERYGLTGPNGAGKSTLLKILMGLIEPHSGSIKLPQKIGFLRQDIEHFGDQKVLDVVIQGNQKLFSALKERDELYLQEMTDEIGMKLGEIEGIIADEDGYMAESNAEILLSGMSIDSSYWQRPLREVPIDLQFRVLLCQALFGDPRALILDEPTNHLDMESIRWLERFLIDYKGVMIVVSHDRHFLNAVATQIADIDYETVILYPGNYDQMVMAKTAVRQSAELEAKSKEKKIEKLQEFIAKFGAGTRASQVQSRKKEMEKLKPQELKQSNIQRPYIAFTPSDKQPGKIVLKIEHLSKQYGDHKVIQDFSFEIHRGDKIGIIGNNGLGKTTLIKMLAHVQEPNEGCVTPDFRTLVRDGS